MMNALIPSRKQEELAVEEPNRPFPFERLVVNSAAIYGSINYNPHAEMPPKCRWGISLGIEPIKLPEVEVIEDFGDEVIDSDVILDDINLDVTTWRRIAGEYRFNEEQNGSFYVNSSHNPVDVTRLNIIETGINRFDVEAQCRFFFEFEGTGYEDGEVRLAFPASHSCVTFYVPKWNKPDEVEFPGEWGIPSVESDWPEAELIDFVGRHIDLSDYEEPEVSKNRSVTLKPKA